MRVAKQRVSRWRVAAYHGLGLICVATFAIDRYFPSSSVTSLVGLAALATGVALAGERLGWWGRKARAIGRRRERGAFIVGGASPGWVEFRRDLAFFGDGSSRARYLSSDLENVSYSEATGEFFATLKYADGRLQWRLASRGLSVPDFLAERRRFGAALTAWCSAPASGRAPISPHIPSARQAAPWAAYYIATLATAYGPMPGVAPRFSPAVLALVVLAAVHVLPPLVSRRNRCRSGWTFDDERGRPAP